MDTTSDEWVVGPLWVRPLVAGRWELGIADGPVDHRSKIIGFIVRVGDLFEVTMLSSLQAGSSFGSLLSAIDFITHTLPAWGDAFGAARTASPGPEAGVDDGIGRPLRNAVKKTHLVVVPSGVSRERSILERWISGDDALRGGPVAVSAGSEGDWAVVHESGAGVSTLIGLVYQIGSRFEVTVMSDPLRMVSVDSLAAAVDHLAVDGETARRLRVALRR